MVTKGRAAARLKAAAGDEMISSKLSRIGAYLSLFSIFLFFPSLLGASSIEDARVGGTLDLDSAQKATSEILSANQITPAPRKNSQAAMEQPRAAEVLSPGVIYTASANCTGENPRPYNVCLDIGRRPPAYR